DFLHTTIFYTDAIQHFFWKEMENRDEKFGDAIERIWRIIDAEIGKLLNQLGEDTNIFVMSDHGFVGLKATFSLNRWLWERGYLDISLFNMVLTNLWLYNRRTSQVIEKLGLDRVLRRLIPREKLISLQERMLPNEVSSPYLITQVDWSTTKAINVGECGVFLNPKLDPDEYEAVRTRLIEEIERIRNPKTGEKLVASVKKREELYHGEHLNLAPDLIVVPNEGYRIYDSLLRSSWEYSKNVWSAYHKLQGIFIAYGPDIKEGGRVENAKIYDLAPTILHMFQVPIPRDMDGRVLTEIFREDSEIARRQILYHDADVERAIVRKKITMLRKLKKI
nr:alkaline phosphatase family protein [Candidatus Freyarchaeota archaeon]